MEGSLSKSTSAAYLSVYLLLLLLLLLLQPLLPPPAPATDYDDHDPARRKARSSRSCMAWADIGKIQCVSRVRI